MTYDASEWKPGDVAMVTDATFGNMAVRRIYGEWPAGEGGRWSEGHGGFVRAENVTEARPLVVIDPEDAEQVERLCDALYGGHAGGVAPKVKHALREFARPTPRIEEPSGLGAVVEDVEGRLFVQLHDGWWRSEEPCTVNWSATHAVRILSPGVPS